MNHTTHSMQAAPPPEHDTHKAGHAHSWMMLACCVPMIVFALILFATGVINGSTLLFYAGFMILMTVMMGGMGHGAHGHK
jgi:hypothetical protein